MAILVQKLNGKERKVIVVYTDKELKEVRWDCPRRPEAEWFIFSTPPGQRPAVKS
jgi:hypothetical protein